MRERIGGVRFEEDFSFARHTTIGCGGRAALAAYPLDAERVCALLLYLERERIPHCLLGAGANVLPADGDFDGVVVRFSALNELRADGTAIYAGAGVTGGALCRFARAKALGGFEPLTGIPLTVGGGIAMNAGVREGHFSDLAERVFAVENGILRTFGRADCAFAEKESVFQGGLAIVGAILRGERRPSAEIEARTAHFRAARAHLPHGRSMGCVFVNPAGDSAGRLIEHCGLKGCAVGGARVSEIHANFILNEGGTSRDVSELIGLVKERVRDKTGILLREEIRRIP